MTPSKASILSRCAFLAGHGVEGTPEGRVETMEPGDLAYVGVVFVEDRNGRALVRLPNGWKTSLDYDALRVVGGPVHFVRGEGTTERVYCQACDWSAEADSRRSAEDLYEAHRAADHS